MIITNFDDEIRNLQKTIAIYELSMKESLSNKEFSVVLPLLVRVIELQSKIDMMEKLK